MLTNPQRPALSRPRPEIRAVQHAAPGSGGSGGEGGNRSSRLATMIGSNGLLAAALILSAALVALATAALR